MSHPFVSGSQMGRGCLRGALGYTPQSHTLSSPRVASGPLAQDRGRRAGLLRGSGLEAGLSVCTCVPVCAGMSVCGVRAGGRQTGKGGSDAGMGGRERIGLWKGVKTLQRKILAGTPRCPLPPSVGLADFFSAGASFLPLASEEPGSRG